MAIVKALILTALYAFSLFWGMMFSYLWFISDVSKFNEDGKIGVVAVVIFVIVGHTIVSFLFDQGDNS